jgi:hypothetical protein
MKISLPAALAAVLAAAAAQAQSPAVKELIAFERKAAMAKCLTQRDSYELTIASGMGNSPRAAEVQARIARAMESPLEAEGKRISQAYVGKHLSEADNAALLAALTELRERCPWRKSSVPYQLPPAKNDDEARLYATTLVPLALVNLRICEVTLPETRGKLEAAWESSRLRELDVPEMQEMVALIRPWMKTGYDVVHPDSLLARQRKDPNTTEMSKMQCARAPGELKKVETAIPDAFFTKHRRR